MDKCNCIRMAFGDRFAFFGIKIGDDIMDIIHDLKSENPDLELIPIDLEFGESPLIDDLGNTIGAISQGYIDSLFIIDKESM